MRAFVLTLLKSLIAALLLIIVFAGWRVARYGWPSLQDHDFRHEVAIYWIVVGPGCVLVALIQIIDDWIGKRRKK